MENKKLFLLDAYALIFRAYYAFIRAQMINSKGMNTSAIYGFTATLDEILRTESPSHIAVVFDTPHPTFRHEKFPEYKATRDETPEEIKKAVPWIKKILEAFRIPVLESPGFEADDLIGTLSRKAASEGYEVYMMTPDKDYAQLVSNNVFIYKPRRSGNEAEVIGVEEVREKFQIEDPMQVIDILALWGDSSDNIPGAPGIGEKTAKKLIKQYQSVENLIAHADQLKGKQKESIQENAAQIMLSKELVTIRLDVPVELRAEELKYAGADTRALAGLFNELEFKTLAERILSGFAEADGNRTAQANLFGEKSEREAAFSSLKEVEHHYQLADKPESRSRLIGLLKAQRVFCLDTETTDLVALNAELVGIAFAWEARSAWYVPFPPERKEAEKLLAELAPVLENPEVIIVGQNLKYDLQVLRNYGTEIRGKLFDTLIAHYLLQPEQKHGLDELAENYLGYRTIKTEELIGKKGRSQLNMREVPLDRLCDYACEDADITWQLYTRLEQEIRETGLEELAMDLEFPLISVLCKIEEAGVKIDTAFLQEYAGTLNQELIRVRDEIYKLSGTEFNISSPKQLGEVLFDHLKITADAQKTRTRQYSTSEEVLSKLADKHPVISRVLEFRTIRKMLSTYVEALPRMINARTGYIHTSFNQAVTATGRLSSNQPNLQNIPIREEIGREIRKAFIPRRKDHVILSADYSQIELRLMAHMSGDPVMIAAFREGKDIHTATAARIFNVSLEEVSKEQRGRAKTANFGIIYGISAFGLAQRMKIPRSEAKELIESYFQTYQRIREYMDESIALAREKGYVETILGRRRYLRDIDSRNAVVRGFAERNAINAPIQGSAADVIKIAMIQIQSALDETNWRSRMIMQVHDELVFDVYQPELEALTGMVLQKMENALELKVPLVADYGSGNNWLEAH